MDSEPPSFFRLGRGLWDIKPGNAYHSFFSQLVAEGLPRAAPAKRKHIIIIGGGVGGLTAAYELAKAGHRVTILEKQTRAGGRLKSWRASSAKAFAPGVHGEAGAMRLKGVSPVPEANHFIVDHYVDQFAMQTAEFHNDTPEGFMCFQGERIQKY